MSSPSIHQFASGVDTLHVDATFGGPPPEVFEQIAAAASFAEELRENGYHVRFFSHSGGQAPRIELHDADGQAVSVLSTAEAFELTAGGTAAIIGLA